MEDSSKPPTPLRVGLTYNLKKNVASDIADIEAEYDSIDTVLAIKKALESAGTDVIFMEADRNLPQKLLHQKVDIVFNIAEGGSGKGREAHVPAILSFLQIPFTGSDETTLCIALDKALTKRILSTYGIRTPGYFVVSKDHPDIKTNISFPVIVKPNAEGSSKGISDAAVVSDMIMLRSLIQQNIESYGQDMLVEEYIHGREFTVGVLGNGNDMRVFAPMEIVYLDDSAEYNIYSFNVKKNYKKLIRYECPADISAKTESEMADMAKKIYTVLGCRDFSRIDFRLSQDLKPYFIEINPLPGLAPGYSDYTFIAEFSGMDYETLVRSVLTAALKRYGFDYVLNRGNEYEFQFL